MLEVKTFVGPAFAQNAYLVWRKGNTEAVAIDPGAGVGELIAGLESEQLTLAAILLTHAHIDHIEGIAPLKRHADAPIYLHPGDNLFYQHVGVQAAQFGLRVETPPPPERTLEHATTLEIAGISFAVTHVPGHSPGHVMFYVAEANCAFVGDVVFQNSIGRTDLPGGEYQTLMTSIRDHVMTLPDDTTLYAGHGPATTVKQERTFNPFIAPMYGGSFA